MTFTEPLCCIDMGTTNCRVFLFEGNRILARVEGEFGVRDVARALSREDLRSKLEALILEAAQQAQSSGPAALARYALGAGMLTSAQGLMEIPHVAAPAAGLDLARNMVRFPSRLARSIELFLVPGVRTGTVSTDAETTLRSDLMRGEETLVFGLLATGSMKPNTVLFNLGSHWKWIWADSNGRIARSRTALTGELIHVTQCLTLLSSGLPRTKPVTLHEEWLDLGSREVRRSGLTRSLFCVRLLEQAGHGTPEERLSFLYGAFLEAEFAAVDRDESFADLRSICITGPPALAEAWKQKLSPMQCEVHIVREEDRERAYVEGLGQIFLLAQQHGSLSAKT
jgi:2-dehydro-3-deoxygalactonokinase